MTGYNHPEDWPALVQGIWERWDDGLVWLNGVSTGQLAQLTEAEFIAHVVVTDTIGAHGKCTLCRPDGMERGGVSGGLYHLINNCTKVMDFVALGYAVIAAREGTEVNPTQDTGT